MGCRHFCILRFNFDLLLDCVFSRFCYFQCGMCYNLQECLNGEFVRVGPNPKFSPVAGYHWYGLLSFKHFCADGSFIILVESRDKV